jgi:hypothetical protein
VVQIGLDRNTKLQTVFNRFVEFCNEQASAQQGPESSSSEQHVTANQLEFVHCQLLHGNETAESAALMKSDRITVRREQSDERKEEEAFNRLQREIDKEYFVQMRTMAVVGHDDDDDEGEEEADVVLDCRGALSQEWMKPVAPRCQRTALPCSSCIVSKRCPWLGRMIEAARLERKRRSIVTVPEQQEVRGGREQAKESEEEDDLELLQLNRFRLAPHQAEEGGGVPAAAQIENYDEEQPVPVALSPQGVSPQGVVPGRAQDQREDDDGGGTSLSRKLWVTLEHHSPEAVKLLLEYCCTNRVLPLGHEAFVQACRTKPVYKKLVGPVPPYSVRPSRWPSGGVPLVSFSVAMAGIALAEEASMPRLSLMCEVAASLTVDTENAVEALAACEEQRQLHGNPLPRLRKAAVDLVLRSARHRDVSFLLKNALQERGTLLVPTLITGTMEAVEESTPRSKKGYGSSSLTGKRDWQAMAYPYFDIVDRDDYREREMERRKRRKICDPYNDEDDDLYTNNVRWGGGSGPDMVRRSLKRMSHHLGGRLSSRVPANALPRLPKRRRNGSRKA